MRLIWIVALGVLALELILGLAFWAGWAWIGGWPGGLGLLALALVLMILPWLGDLTVDVDSEVAKADVGLGWIGRFTRMGEPKHETRMRFLFFHWTRRDGVPRKKKKKGKPHRVRAPRRGRVGTVLDSVPPIFRMVSAGAQALIDLALDAHEFSLEVQSPTPLSRANTALAGIIGTRQLGPVRLQVSGRGERAFRLRYRIKFARAAAIGLSALIQARPDRGIRAIRRIRESMTFRKEED
jgi:hypothetical protein